MWTGGDDLQAGITAGNIIEENHYYAYGLKIAMLSSTKLGDSYEGELKNNYLYQGAFAELDNDIGWQDFAFRNYDAQIGRWVQQDPFDEFASPYVGMGDDPVNLTDPSGGFTLGGLTKGGTAAILTLGGAIIGTAVDLISGGDGFTGTLIGAGAGLGLGLGNLLKHISAGMCIQTANAAVTAINLSINSNQVGRQLSGSNSGSGSTDDEGYNKGHAGNAYSAYDIDKIKQAWLSSLPIFIAESKYPDIQRVDLLYYEIAPPWQKTIISGVKYLIFSYESNTTQQRKNGYQAYKANPQCAENRVFDEQCHEVPYKSTKEGGSNAIMMPAKAKENMGHGTSLGAFYRSLKDGDYFLVPLGKGLKEPEGRPSPAPVFSPKTQTKILPKPKFNPENYAPQPVNPTPALIATAVYLLSEYWWVILAL